MAWHGGSRNLVKTHQTRRERRGVAGEIAIDAAASHIVVMANNQQPERPRVEPEILPPERSDGPPRPAGVFVHRVFIARPGLPSILLALLIIALVAALVFLVLAGLVLIWIPVLIVGVVAAILPRLFGGRRA
jgi:Flp pilus assembly protein TadB